MTFCSAGKKSKKLQCKMCGKIAHNHASHRLHVVSKHFSNFWAQVKSDDYGVFTCHHSGCEYRSSNRQVFVIHQAFVHSELKTKLVESGQDPSLGEPLGKRYQSSFCLEINFLSYWMGDIIQKWLIHLKYLELNS